MKGKVLVMLAALALAVCMLPSTAYADRWMELDRDNIQKPSIEPPLEVQVGESFTANDIFPGKGFLGRNDITWQETSRILADCYPLHATASGRIAVYLKSDMNVSRDVIVTGALMLSEQELWLDYQKTKQLKVTYNGEPVDGTEVRWQSRNSSVAAVSSDGTVRASGAGETYITALYNGEAAVCEVIADSGTQWVVPRYTGLRKEDGEWIYIQNGRYNRNYSGLAMYEGEWIYFNQGAPDASYTGFVDYKDVPYLVCNGRACTELNGLQQNPADQKFYFLAEGRLQKHTGWAEYDDHWFILKEGQPDTAQTGLVEYNGGTFAAAAGQVLTDYSGLFLNAGAGIMAPDNQWYFLSNGQVQKQYSGLALYDGHWFYVQNGVMADKLTGIVPHDGAEFYVINGEVASGYTGVVNYSGKQYLVIKGQVDYDNGTGQKVWIDMTAAKYHLRRDCSGMDDAFQVSVEKARELGRTACKKCFR